jgi:hypothetical protein
MNDNIIEKQKITFNDTIYYYYIETKEDIIDADLKKDLWWSPQEMALSRAIYLFEIQQFMKMFPQNDLNTVKKELWLVLDFDEIYKQQEKL